MAQVLTRPGAPREGDQFDHATHSPDSPTGRRSGRPRWRDARLMTGVLLILASVALGGHLIGSASRTTAWVSVTRSLPAGHVLAAADLSTVQAHLPASTSGRYFATSSGLAGKTLTTPLQAGELLPAAALAQAPAAEGRIVPVVVRSGRLPALAAGDRVDVYVLAKSSATTAGPNGREVRVLTAAEFVSADVLSSGDTSLQLRVAPRDAITAVAASQSGRVDIVRVDGSTGQSADAGPSSIDGFGTS
jgi:hypothetical protein